MALNETSTGGLLLQTLQTATMDDDQAFKSISDALKGLNETALAKTLEQELWPAIATTLESGEPADKQRAMFLLNGVMARLLSKNPDGGEDALGHQLAKDIVETLCRRARDVHCCTSACAIIRAFTESTRPLVQAIFDDGA